MNDPTNRPGWVRWLRPLALLLLAVAAVSLLCAGPVDGGDGTGGSPAIVEDGSEPVDAESRSHVLEVRRAHLDAAPGRRAVVAAGWPDSLHLDPRVLLDDRALLDAAMVPMPDSTYTVSVQFDSTGSVILAEATAQLVGEVMAILVDGEVVVAARVAAPITGGRARLAGQWDADRARAVAFPLVELLRARQERVRSGGSPRSAPDDPSGRR